MSAEIMRSDAEWQFLLDTANRRIAELEKENARLQSVISVLQQEAEPGRYVGPYDAEFWGER